MRINQPELEPRPNDVTHGVPYQEDGVYNEIEDTYLEVIDDADITNKHSDLVSAYIISSFIAVTYKEKNALMLQFILC
jgi:hypothetical protein